MTERGIKKKIVYGKRMHMNPTSVFYMDEAAHSTYMCFTGVYAMQDWKNHTGDTLLTIENSSEATPLSVLLL